MAKQRPVWLITGCSTGFGRELAKLVLFRTVSGRSRIGLPIGASRKTIGS